MISWSAPDLTVHPPRSPRLRLGGFVHLPRLLDKSRAFAAGKQGEYIYPCPLDKRLFAFTGIDPDAFLEAVKTGRNDTEMLAWVTANTRPARAPHEILAWSAWLENLAPGDADRHGQFADAIRTLAPGRDDIRTTFDRLDLDDYTSFGGKA
ncbi:hypothetical protein OpiT1DRAFT_05462 [Opitutaceae bacterium TAV1]|nr:hypothetical protein OPIT5_30005 [Opitutaceae bacterium TAV5]EIQ00904.1 hypothetical protein OpiT1DRAFT_05462 [Opitutaceae bacterium TAV1]